MSEIAPTKRKRGRPFGTKRGRKIYSWKEYYSKKKADPVRYQQYLIKQRLRTQKHYHSGKGRANMIQKSYGLSPEQYQLLTEVQNNLCAICFRPPIGNVKVLSVDHDHKTGKVRGLLCQPCNRALGFLREDIEIITRLLEYVKKHKVCQK